MTASLEALRARLHAAVVDAPRGMPAADEPCCACVDAVATRAPADMERIEVSRRRGRLELRRDDHDGTPRSPR